MNERECLDVMNSDFALWNKAHTEEPAPGVMVKTITLPWGIGETEIRLEGLTDANKRRDAVATYGDYIRSIIRDATSDEAVEARAKQAAAKAEPADSGDSIYLGPGALQEPTAQAQDDAPAGEAHEGDAEDDGDFGAGLIARRAALLSRIRRAEADLARWSKEGKGIDAALKAMGVEIPDE